MKVVASRALAALFALVLLGLLALAGAWAGGLALPAEHVTTSRARFDRPPEAVWRALHDVEVQRWRCWPRRLESRSLEIVSAHPPERLVLSLRGERAPVQGHWTIDLARADAGTTVSVTETARVRGPLRRFVARFVVGRHAALDAFLTSLAGHLDQPPDITHLR